MSSSAETAGDPGFTTTAVAASRARSPQRARRSGARAAGLAPLSAFALPLREPSPVAIAPSTSCPLAASSSITTLAVTAAGNGAGSTPPLSASSARVSSINRRTMPVAPTSRVAAALDLADAEEGAQADEIEKAKLAEVDDGRWGLLTRGCELGLQQDHGVQVELADQPQADAAGLGLAARHDQWRRVLVGSQPRTPIADERERRGASFATPTGVRAAEIGQESLGPIQQNYTRRFARSVSERRPLRCSIGRSVTRGGRATNNGAAPPRSHLFRRFRRISRKSTVNETVIGRPFPFEQKEHDAAFQEASRDRDRAGDSRRRRRPSRRQDERQDGCGQGGRARPS